MGQTKRTQEELLQKQALPLEQKVQLTERRVREWYEAERVSEGRYPTEFARESLNTWACRPYELLKQQREYTEELKEFYETQDLPEIYDSDFAEILSI